MKNSPYDATSKKAKVRPAATTASFVLDNMARCAKRDDVIHFVEVLAGWPSIHSLLAR